MEKGRLDSGVHHGKAQLSRALRKSLRAPHGTEGAIGGGAKRVGNILKECVSGGSTAHERGDIRGRPRKKRCWSRNTAANGRH